MMIGDTVGQYRVTQLIGEGGMGAVYKAIDTMIEREVAIKVLRPEIAHQKNLLERFRTEAVTLAKLNYAGIAMLYSFLQEGDQFYMILEYVPGKTLECVEQEHGALDYKTAVPLFVKILEAMQPAHEMGIMHRDVKPANIMLTTWGTVKLMDFGIARVLGAARQTRQGALVGTMEYIAPERIKGKEGGPAADIYSLGVVLYEMLAGQLPFRSENEYELMRMHLENVAPTFAEVGVSVPREIEAVAQKSMAKQEEDRYATCDEFIEALQSVAGGARIAKREIIALVGQVTVAELGTAGHSSGETTGAATSNGFPAVSSAEPLKREIPGKDSGSLAAFIRLRKVPLLAAAAAIVAIGLGVGFGLLARHGQATSAPNPPMQQNEPASASEPTVNQPPAPVTPVATSPSIPSQPIQTTPVAPPPQSKPEPKPSEKKREKALKALDE
jgi:serine/threonine-protein kinase